MRGQYNLDQLRALRETGLSTEVISPRPWFPGLSRKSTNGAPFPPPLETIEGFRVAHPRALYMPLSRSALNGVLYGLSVAASCREALARTPADFLWASFAFPDGVGLARVARRAGKPLVLSVLGSDVNVSFRLPGRRSAMLSAFAESRLVLAKSARLREVLVEGGVGAGKVVVDYNGVAAEAFRPRPQAEACAELGVEVSPRVLFVGNLVPIKGLADLLEAWARVVAGRRGSPVELALVGQGPLEAELRARARALGILPAIRFAGAQPRARVAAWMAASTALVLPSLDEGVPNVVLEALASGRPVVATAVGGVPEVHPGEMAGSLVPARDVAALARALDGVLDRRWDPPGLRATVGELTWPQNARRVSDALEKALGQPNGFGEVLVDEAAADRVPLSAGR